MRKYTQDIMRYIIGTYVFLAATVQAQTCPYSIPHINEIQVTSYFASQGSQMVWPAESISVEGPNPFFDPTVTEPNSFILSMSCGAPLISGGPNMTQIVTADLSKGDSYGVTFRKAADGCYKAVYGTTAGIHDEIDINRVITPLTVPDQGVYPVGNEAAFRIVDTAGHSSLSTSTAPCFGTNRGSQCQCGVPRSPDCSTD